MKGGGRLYGLDALRGVAALVVVMFHVSILWHLTDALAHAPLMVDFFFVLSGFVMARTYEKRMADSLGPTRFLWLRAKRLWKPIAIAAFFGFCLQAGSGMPLLHAITILSLALVFLPDLIWKPGSFPLNGPEWSIMFELAANLVHALLLWRLGRAGLIVVAALSFAAIVVCQAGLGHPVDAFVVIAPRTLLGYSIGILIWRTLGDRPRLAFWPAPVLLVGVLPVLWAAGYHHDAILHAVVTILVMPVVLVCGLGLQPGTAMKRAASLSGALSFPLYAVHSPILAMFVAARLPWPLAVVSALGVAAWVAFRVEAQGKRLLATTRQAVEV